MTTTTASKLADGTLVLMIGQADTAAHPVRAYDDEEGRPGVEYAGGVLTMMTEWNQLAPAAEVTLPDTVANAEVRRNTEAAVAWQRKYWIARLGSVWVGEFRTKTEALAAVRVAAGVLAWQQANGDTCEDCGQSHPGKTHNRD